MKLQKLTSGAIIAACAVVAGSAVYFPLATLRQLKSQNRVDLAFNLERQFDADYKQDRGDCARAFLYGGERTGKKKKKGLADAPWSEVMDFFDSLGYLVDRGAVDEEIARYYLAYELDGYFQATQNLMRAEQRKNPRRYRNVFPLYQRWHEDAPRADLTSFFEDELDFAEPPPPDEGPRT